MKRYIGFTFLFLFLHFSLPVFANENIYIVEEITIDGNIHILQQTKNLEEATNTYKKNYTTSNNIQLRKNQEILDVKYGVVVLKTTPTCDFNVEYTTAYGNGYTNGCYGIDAAYLKQDNLSQYQFQISEAIATTSKENVQIQAIELSKRTSMWEVKDGKLYHHIKSQMNDDTFSNTISFGEAPKYLKNNQFYYSYDGHYFYEADDMFQGFHRMIDDIRNQNPQNAINKDTPYYNYYQYLSHRSYTNYNEQEMKDYLEKKLYIQSPLTYYRRIYTSSSGALTQSLLYNQQNAFLQNQYIYGLNAMMMLSLAMNESATGRSYLAFSRNNLFGHAAYDSDVEANASKYFLVSNSIYSHAYNYLHKSYLNPKSFTYHGGWFGNKASGMNVSYASDPYWGEKAAQYYQLLDEAQGKKDYLAYGLGLITKKQAQLYQEIGKDPIAITFPQPNFIVTILGEKEGFYEILFEQTNGNSYHPNTNTFFIKKEEVEIVSKLPKENKTTFYPITFDANQGTFDNKQSILNLYVPAMQIPAVTTPIKPGYLFTGWDTKIQKATKETTYKAQYEKILSVKLSQLPKQTYVFEELLDVRNGMLEIVTENKTLHIPLSSDMISNFDSKKTGKQMVQVHYQGASTSYEVEIKPSQITSSEEFIQTMEHFVNALSIPLSKQQEATLQNYLKQLEEGVSFYIPQDTLRKLDALKQATNDHLSIVIEDSTASISMSNLSLQLPAQIKENTTLSVTVIDSISKANKKKLQNLAKAYGYEEVSYFQIQSNQNSDPLDIQYPISITYPKPDKQDHKIQYSIFHIEDNDIIQLPVTTNLNTINFSTTTFGEFLIVKKNTNNSYITQDIVENNQSIKPSNSLYLSIIAGLLVITTLILFYFLFLYKRSKKSIIVAIDSILQL